LGERLQGGEVSQVQVEYGRVEQDCHTTPRPRVAVGGGVRGSSQWTTERSPATKLTIPEGKKRSTGKKGSVSMEGGFWTVENSREGNGSHAEEVEFLFKIVRTTCRLQMRRTRKESRLVESKTRNNLLFEWGAGPLMR